MSGSSLKAFQAYKKRQISETKTHAKVLKMSGNLIEMRFYIKNFLSLLHACPGEGPVSVRRARDRG